MSLDLFSSGTGLTPVPLEGGDLYFLEKLATRLAPQEILSLLIQETDWRAETLVLWGKQCLQPRLSAWYGDAHASYRYSGKTFAPLVWTALLTELRQEVEAATSCQFNSVLLNYYRDQRDGMGFHSDNEPELGPSPAIASLSFGEMRTFILKPKFNKALRPVKLGLGDGNLLLMAGDTQKNWRHGINKETGACGSRINLTFRKIVSFATPSRAWFASP